MNETIDDMLMNKPLRRKYHRFREAGYQAADALRAAKILRDWEAREWGEFDKPEIGDVRLRAEPDDESPFDVYGEPEGYTTIHGRIVSAEKAREEAVELYERFGVWWSVSEYWDGAKWLIADSIGMHTGYEDVLSPFENWYIPGMMAAAIEKAVELEKEITERERESERIEETARQWGDWRLDLLADELTDQDVTIEDMANAECTHFINQTCEYCVSEAANRNAS